MALILPFLSVSFQSDGSAVSIFAFDLKNASKLIYARNALKRFKTFRHPNILPCIHEKKNKQP